jgi:hypothetical protein
LEAGAMTGDLVERVARALARHRTGRDVALPPADSPWGRLQREEARAALAEIAAAAGGAGCIKLHLLPVLLGAAERARQHMPACNGHALVLETNVALLRALAEAAEAPR